MAVPDRDYWAAPEAEEILAPASRPNHPPGVWRWFVAFSGLVALVYLVLSASSFFLAWNIVRHPSSSVDHAKGPFLLAALMTAVAAALFGVGPFLPRRPWAWTYGLALLVVGLPWTLPLLIYWLRPRARAFFGRRGATG